MGKKIDSAITKLVRIPKIFDDCFLCFIQYPDKLPFIVKRAYYILNASISLSRGYHAHYKTKQILFCIQGSIRMVIDDGLKREEILLDSPEVGIFLDKLIWHEMHDFKKDTILLVLASDKFNEKDYIRNYEEFKRLINK